MVIKMQEENILGIPFAQLGQYKAITRRLNFSKTLGREPKLEDLESRQFFESVYPQIRQVAKITTDEIANLRESFELGKRIGKEK